MPLPMKCRWLSLLLSLSLLGLAGCSSWVLEGAERTRSAPTHAPVYEAPACVLKDGRWIRGSLATYHLLDTSTDRPVLYELSRGRRGAKITNGWRDDDGVHFFAWVPGGPGYRYSFPADPERPPRRVVYAADQYRRRPVAGAPGRFQPDGRAGAVCPLDRARSPTRR